MLKADDLENLVWDTFCEMIHNPKIVLEQVERLQQDALKQTNTLEQDLAAFDAKLSAVATEETRLLDAYRENIIDMEQLKTQMAKIKERMAEITNKRQELLNNQEKFKSKLFTKENLTLLCNMLADNLKSFENDAEMKRKILTLAVNSILIEGKAVRIRSVIPTRPPEEALLRPQLPHDRASRKRQDNAGTTHTHNHAGCNP